LTELHGLILAGGLGSRLAADGVDDPKPLVRLGGMPQVARLANSLRAAGCERVTCMARDDLAPRIADALAQVTPPVRVVPCRTPSSLHTLVAGLRALDAPYALCTLVDTFMADDDWAALGPRATQVQAGELDLLLAVTPFADDDPHPLYVEVDDAARVRCIGEMPPAAPAQTASPAPPASPARPLVTGGIYLLGPAAQRLAAACLEAGHSRLRSFLARAPRHLAVGAVEIERMIDIDYRADLEAAACRLAERLEPSRGTGA
jgi:molybdopterin-guanine dinucleotide biosynthesis protein A